MAQTTNVFGFVSGSPRYEYNTTGASSAFTDASGEIVSWNWGAGERRVGETNTIDGDLPLIAPGKLGATDVTIVGVYTSASSGLWQDALTAYQNGTALYWRVYPAGSAAGRYRFNSGNTAGASVILSNTNGACYVTQRPVPNAEATSGDVFTYEVTIRAAGFTGGSL